MIKRKLRQAPKNSYSLLAADRVLGIADSYLKNEDRLIYSYGSKTFLSGYDLFDPGQEGRGNIDCSTFILLVLAGISYEDSPYSTGVLEGLKPDPQAEIDLSCFREIPDRYLGIAERIGRPYLAGTKGLDLEKAEAMGISVETLWKEIQNSGVSRRSVLLASQFTERDECFWDPAFRMPGDLVFYRSEEFTRGDMDDYPIEVSVSHVGIISKDRDQMINSSGYLDRQRVQREKLPAVSQTPVFGRRQPAFFARPDYNL